MSREVLIQVLKNSGLPEPEYPALLEALQSPAPVSIRANPLKASSLHGSPIPWCTQGLYLAERPVFALDPHWHAGAYYVQEASSMFVGYTFEKLGLHQASMPMLDLCAAPGGKSTHIASLMADGSLLLANETIGSRVSVLLENIIKWGNPDVWVTQNDPENFKPFAGKFGLVLVDAPCSGEGLFRKDPESIKQWSDTLPQMCALRQKRILHEALPLVAEGGYLFYSTCTFNPLENEGQLELMLQAGFEPAPIPVNGLWGIEEVNFNGCIAYRFWPHHLQGEGFFFAAFRRPGKFEWPEMPPAKTSVVPRVSSIANVIEMKDAYQIQQWKLNINAVQKQHLSWQNYVYTHLRPRRAAFNLGELKGADFIPSHELALCPSFHAKLPQIELSLDEALTYLRRENLGLSTEADKGWAFVSYKGMAIGRIKVLSGRVNNYYPPEYRLRMQQ